jgi:predicted nuclease of restriction endonuclease-like (RecB) superfamily
MAAKRVETKSQAAPAKLPVRSRGRVRAEGAEFPVPPLTSELPGDYPAVLTELKRRIVAAQTRAAAAVTRELMGLYWYVGKTIVERQQRSGWGSAVVERLAHDLREAFPGIEGFSPRNIWRMRQFFLAWAQVPKKLTRPVSESAPRAPASKLPQAVSELPWGHNIVLIQQVERYADRLWYAEQARGQGWSRPTLQAQIRKKLRARQSKATTNFARTLSPSQSSLAHETLKDPYVFDFLTVGREAHERVVERDLLAHVKDFLLELGAGFAFMGNQVKLVVGGNDYFIDLLFYHVRLRAHVVVELKATSFKPEYTGKMNFYLSAVDDLLKQPDDRPSIGLLLCKSRDRMQVEYALRDVAKPIGVAQWQTELVDKLPKALRGSLPTVEEIEAELGGTGAPRTKRSSRTGRKPSRGGA